MNWLGALLLLLGVQESNVVAEKLQVFPFEWLMTLLLAIGGDCGFDGDGGTQENPLTSIPYEIGRFASLRQ